MELPRVNSGLCSFGHFGPRLERFKLQAIRLGRPRRLLGGRLSLSCLDWGGLARRDWLNRLWGLVWLGVLG